MKIIDLLNKISKDEAVPKNIKLDEKIYEYDIWECDYRLIGENYSYWLFQEFVFGGNGNKLNVEVKVIEEELKTRGE